MGFSLVKSWDNRGKPVVIDAITRRSWTRRIQWLSDNGGNIKLKLEDGLDYREVMANGGFAQTIWDRFKDGQSIKDSISILYSEVPKHLKSRKG